MNMKQTMNLSLAVLACVCGMSTMVATDSSVQLEFRDGRVWLTATDASRAMILAEWARRGQVTIVNGERVGGEAITLELRGVPEREGLDSILRGITGYLVAERRSDSAGAARFDRISILTDIAAMPPTRNDPPPAAAGGVERDPATKLLEDALRLTGFVEDRDRVATLTGGSGRRKEVAPGSAMAPGAQTSSDSDPLAQLLRSVAAPQPPR